MEGFGKLRGAGWGDKDGTLREEVGKVLSQGFAILVKPENEVWGKKKKKR